MEWLIIRLEERFIISRVQLLKNHFGFGYEQSTNVDVKVTRKGTMDKKLEATITKCEYQFGKVAKVHN